MLEEFLQGEEVSYFIITDGKNFKTIGTAQDHKRIGEGDTGLNTGGMGAYSPSLIMNSKLEKKIIDNIIKPTLDGLNKIGITYKGILYAGLMVYNQEPKLIEYNIRFGDPECQVLMMRMESNLLDIILSVFNETLIHKTINWNLNPGITVVAASKGYPKKFVNNEEIVNINDVVQNDTQQLFHAGTIKGKKDKIFTNGGRVLNSTVISETLADARYRALKILDQLDWSNKYYRRDIGFKVIGK